MFKILLNLLLSLIIGKLKPILLKRISDIDDSIISDTSKREIVLQNFKSDLIEAGKEIKDSLLNLVIEVGVSYLKGK